MEEVWITPDNFSIYRFSNFGRIIKIKTNNTIKIFNAKPHPTGYIYATLRNDNGEIIHSQIGRFIAQAFIPNYENKPFVDHINRNRADNKVTNLRWVTAAENIANRDLANIFFGRQVVQYDSFFNFVRVWPSVSSIVREFNSTKYYVEYACKNRTLLSNAYWIYLDTIPIEGEEWRPISVYGNIIMASSVGRVRLPGGKVTYGCKHESGYLHVDINGYKVLTHRIICQAYNPITEPEKFQVNHKDCEKDNNNNAFNLEWMTASENIFHSYQMKGSKSNHLVAQYDTNGTLLAIHSIAKFSASTGINQSNIIKVCEGERNTAGGYRWEYLISSA